MRLYCVLVEGIYIQGYWLYLWGVSIHSILYTLWILALSLYGLHSMFVFNMQ